MGAGRPKQGIQSSDIAKKATKKQLKKETKKRAKEAVKEIKKVAKEVVKKAVEQVDPDTVNDSINPSKAKQLEQVELDKVVSDTEATVKPYTPGDGAVVGGIDSSAVDEEKVTAAMKALEDMEAHKKESDIAKIKGPKRLPKESFDKYKERVAWEKLIWKNYYNKRNVVWDSIDAGPKKGSFKGDGKKTTKAKEKAAAIKPKERVVNATVLQKQKKALAKAKYRKRKQMAKG